MIKDFSKICVHFVTVNTEKSLEGLYWDDHNWVAREFDVTSGVFESHEYQ